MLDDDEIAELIANLRQQLTTLKAQLAEEIEASAISDGVILGLKAQLAERDGKRCEHCGSDRLVDNCSRCGAPQCCDVCCQITALKAQLAERDGEIVTIRQRLIDELAKNALTPTGVDTIAALTKRNGELEDRLFTLGEMNHAPCFACGYNGEGYYQPDTHPCAEKHHRLALIHRGEGE
jgi:hypothetical protein